MHLQPLAYYLTLHALAYLLRGKDHSITLHHAMNVTSNAMTANVAAPPTSASMARYATGKLHVQNTQGTASLHSPRSNQHYS